MEEFSSSKAAVSFPLRMAGNPTDSRRPDCLSKERRPGRVGCLLDPLLNSWIFKSRAQQLPTWLVIQNVNNQQKHDIGSGKLVVTGTGGGNQAGSPNINDPNYRGEGIIGELLAPGSPAKGEELPLISSH